MKPVRGTFVRHQRAAESADKPPAKPPSPFGSAHKVDHDRSPGELRKKGHLLRRHFAGPHNAKKALVGRDGAPTAHARMAAKVGEPVPTKRHHVAALARKGKALLAVARAKR